MIAQHITSPNAGDRPHRPKRILRTLSHVLFADPYAIVTTPLAILFAGFVLNGVCAMHEGQALATWRQLIGEGFYTLAVVAFALLALGHLIAVIVEGWRGSKEPDKQDEETQRMSTGPAHHVRKGHDRI